MRRTSLCGYLSDRVSVLLLPFRPNPRSEPMTRHKDKDDRDHSRQYRGEEGDPERAAKEEFTDVGLADGEVSEGVLCESSARWRRTCRSASGSVAVT